MTPIIPFLPRNHLRGLSPKLNTPEYKPTRPAPRHGHPCPPTPQAFQQLSEFRPIPPGVLYALGLSQATNDIISKRATEFNASSYKLKCHPLDTEPQIQYCTCTAEKKKKSGSCGSSFDVTVCTSPSALWPYGRTRLKSDPPPQRRLRPDRARPFSPHLPRAAGPIEGLKIFYCWQILPISSYLQPS